MALPTNFADLLHGPFLPEDIRDGDAAQAKVFLNHEWRDLRLWRYSPFGAELVYEDPRLFSFSKGDELALRIRIGNDETQFSAVVVGPPQPLDGLILVGMRIFLPDQKAPPGQQRRKSQRWACPTEFLPLGIAPHPLRFNDFIHFRVADISAGGLRILTSLRNKLTFVGQRLESTITLPLLGTIQTDLIVRHIEPYTVDGKEYLSLGTEFVSPDADVRASLAEYLLNFAHGVSISTLKEDGFPIRSASKWLDFSYVKTPEEYKEVLDLRHATYFNAGKGDLNRKPSDMSDEFDSRARILIVKHKGKVVGTLRAMFHGDNDSTEQEEYLRYPAGFPKRSEFVEASWICTDPKFKGSDILYTLLAHLLLTAIKSGRRYIVSAAPEALIPFYENCGYHRVRNLKPLAFPYAPGVEQCLIRMDSYRVALGKGISAVAWNHLYGSVVDYMLQQELINPNPYELFRLNLKRFIGNVLSRNIGAHGPSIQ